MSNTLKVIALIILINILLTCITSSAIGTHSIDEQKDEYLRDIAQARILFKNTNLEKLEEYASQIERKWFARNKEHYGYMMLQICGLFSSRNFKDNRQYDLARQYAILTLEKSEKLEEKDKIPIEVELKLVTGHIQSLYKFKEASKNTDWSAQRNSLAKLYFNAWDRLEKQIDPIWDPNESLPPWPRPSAYDGIWFSGMSPEAIKDPHIRAEYKSALDEFWQKQKRYSEQRHLRRLKRMFLPRLQKHLLQLYSGPLFDSKKLETDVLRQDLGKNIISEKLRATILNKVKKRLDEELESKGKN